MTCSLAFDATARHGFTIAGPSLRGLLRILVDRGSAMKHTKLIALAALPLFLAACQSVSYGPSGGGYNPPPQQAGVEGQWTDPNGIVSSFYGGRFETRTTDGTNSLLARGNYTQVNPSLVEIDMTSLVRNTTSKVNCALATPNQLNCTSSSGAQFSLRRKTV